MYTYKILGLETDGTKFEIIGAIIIMGSGIIFILGLLVLALHGLFA